ncbi:MAG: hypothetical protein KF791_18295, partial [Verrucomicrobiae bacterium]|nr:hypothetical protein [Verrucomicrobiae bacterium]
APAISRDGSKVAYVRNTLASDTRVGLPGIFRLVRCAIRIINDDGTGDRELVAFGNNLWITKVSWSPDDTELVFDIAPRLIVNGLELQMGDETRSEIHIVRTSDASIRLLAAAPAAFPSWSPLGSTPRPPDPPVLRATRVENEIQLELTNLASGQQVDLESTTDFIRWTASQTITASTATQNISVPLSHEARAQFFRVRLR